MKNVFKPAFLAMIVLLMSVSALAIPEVNLKSPSNGATTENFRVEFGYGFSQVPSQITQCALFVDGEQVAQRQNLFSYDNNKISFELTEGSHSWFIRCIDSAGEQTTSQTRTITVTSAIESEEGFETIYMNSGERVHVLSLVRGVEGIAIPPMKPRDVIRVKTSKSSYDFDLVKMTAVSGSSLVELRDQEASKIHRIFVGESLDVDLDADGEVDVRFFLEKINRGVEAIIIVQPYPGYEAPPVVVDEEPEVSVPEEVPAEEPTPVEETLAVENPVSTPAVPTEPEALAAPQEKKSFNWLPLIILIVLAAIGGLVYYFMNNKTAVVVLKKEKEVKPKKEVPAPAEKKVEATPAARSQTGSKHQPENFDVIKHTSAPKRK